MKLSSTGDQESHSQSGAAGWQHQLPIHSERRTEMPMLCHKDSQASRPSLRMPLAPSRARPTFDSSALAGRGFDPEHYIATSLACASEEDIHSFDDSLQDLQASTVPNYNPMYSRIMHRLCRCVTKYQISPLIYQIYQRY